MFEPRTIRRLDGWDDPDGLKVYSIEKDGTVCAPGFYVPRLEVVKAGREVRWGEVAGFVIFHEGESPYLVLGWWGNGNELFTSVSIFLEGEWVEDPERYSFCLWDLEIFWHERNCFVQYLYSGVEDLEGYRGDYFAGE